MRLLVVLLALVMSLTLSAQEEKKKGPSPFTSPKNLKVLPAEGLQQTMQAFRAGLGVMCSYCHVQGDFASDDNPKKNIARAAPVAAFFFALVRESSETSLTSEISSLPRPRRDADHDNVRRLRSRHFWFLPVPVVRLARAATFLS